MAQLTVDDNFTFVGGLNTEGGYFTVPKNSWVEGQNIVPKRDGSIERRPAISFESNYQDVSSVLGISSAYTVEMWDNVGGQKNKSWFAVQVASDVYFYESFTGTISNRPVTGTVNNVAMTPLKVDLDSFRAEKNLNSIGTSLISVASVYGNLIITHQDCDPILVKWTAGDNILVYRLKLQVRDFRGITSPIEPTAELTEQEWIAQNFWPEALYNLYNQGWDDVKLGQYKAANQGKYPANTKQWIYGKNNSDNFDTSVLAKVDFGTAPAPRGRFVLEAFHEDRAAAVALLPSTTTLTSGDGQEDFYEGRWRPLT